MPKTLNKISRFENKGISSAAAAVIIATISVTLVGTTYFFSQSLTETITAETFEVIDIFQNRIIVRNTGTQPISKFKTLIDGKEVENKIKDPPVQPQNIGTVIIDLEGISPGRHQLTLVSKSMSQTWTWEFEIVTTTVATTTIVTTTTPVGEASIGANVETKQGIAEIEKPVKWTSKIVVDNPSTVEIRNYKIGLIIPEDASNVVVKDPGENVVSEETSFMVNIARKESTYYTVEYKTSPPYKEESEIKPFISGKKYIKRIFVKSDFIGHYEDVKTFSDIPEELSRDNYIIRLYHIIGDSKTDVTDNPEYTVSLVDSDDDGLIDRVEWIVPRLSEEEFEVEASLTIINVQSYPTLGGNWTVRFNTTGTANLTITAINGTEFGKDLEFLELRCGDNVLTTELTDGVVFVKNYSCDETGYEISKVLQTGKHTLEFRFGDDIEYAYNQVEWLEVDWTTGSQINDADCTPDSPCEFNQYEQFTANATVTCRGGDCGSISGSIRYNETGTKPNELINTIEGATPFYLIPPSDAHPYTHENSGVTNPENAYDDSTLTYAYFRVFDYTGANPDREVVVYEWDFDVVPSNPTLYYTWRVDVTKAGPDAVTRAYIHFYNWDTSSYDKILEVTYDVALGPYTLNLDSTYINSTGYVKVRFEAYAMKVRDNAKTEIWLYDTYIDPISAANPVSCGSMNQGDTCQLNWAVNATGNGLPQDRVIDVNFSSSLASVQENNTNNSYIRITSGVADTDPPTFSNNATNTTAAGQPANFTITISDTTGVSGYIFSTNNSGIWKNSSWASAGGGTPITAWNVTTLNDTVGALVQWKYYANDTTATSYWGVSETYNLTTTSPPDTTPPQWSNNKTYPTSPATYAPDQSYQFNVTWQDPDSDVDVATLTFNGINYTMSNESSEFYYTLTDLATGTYLWNVTANNTDGYENVTDTWTYNVSKAASNISLFINGTEGNTSIVNNTGVNITVVNNISDTTVWLDTNRTGWSPSSGITPYYNTTEVMYSANYGDKINVTGWWNGNDNYTSDSQTYYINITEAPPDTTPPQWSNNATKYDSGVEYIPNLNHGFQVDWNDPESDISKAMFEWEETDNYTMSGSEPTFYYNLTDLAVGTYTWKSYANNTDGYENDTDTWTYEVSKNTSAEVDLFLNDSQDNFNMNIDQYLNTTAVLKNVEQSTIEIWTNYTGGWYVWASCTSCSVLENVTKITQEGIWNFTANFTNANYTPSYESWYVNVTLINQPPNIWNLKVRNENDTEIDVTITGRIVIITVNASDPDNNIDYIEGNFTWPNGTIVYENLTESPTGKPYMYNWTYVIHPNMPPGNASINVTVYDDFGLSNSTNTTLEILPTKELGIDNAPVNFSTVNPGQNVSAIDNQGWPLKVTVGGNTPLNISQMGEEYLTGATYPSIRIYIRNITWNQSETGIFSELSPSFIVVNETVDPGKDQLIYYQMSVPAVEPQKYGGNITIKGEETQT